VSRNLTPSKYWRIAQTLDAMLTAPAQRFVLPKNIAEQSAPPGPGHGLLLADYDGIEQTGLVRYLGIVASLWPGHVCVDWKPVDAAIWVDTAPGRGFWKQEGGFGFAPKKVAGYGLHQLFADTFEDLDVREALPGGQRAVPVLQERQRQDHSATSERRHRAINAERLNPMAIIGEPTSAPRGGYVYVLKSAMGYKVGRTRRMPDRMRTFGVKLPFLYTIPLCAWFDDRIEAEGAYHRIFRDKRINGEWFDLQDADIELIRARTFP
jgi:T5orf172 domain